MSPWKKITLALIMALSTAASFACVWLADVYPKGDLHNWFITHSVIYGIAPLGAAYWLFILNLD